MFSNKMTIAMVLGVALVLCASPLAAQKDEGYLRVKINPWNAGVYVGGQYKGTAAMYGSKEKPLPLKPGQYEVKFVDPRYEDLIVPVQIDKGKTTTIRRGMKPLQRNVTGPFGELKTQGFGNAAVYLNGKYYGNTKELGTAGQELLIAPGTYNMKIVPVGGGAPREEKITINADETLTISKTGAPIRTR